MLRDLWSRSIAFRRVVAALSLGCAALAAYVMSNIPQAASLPNDQVNKLAVAGTNEQLRIYKPRIDVGDPALSFEGAANVGAEVWVQQASLTGTSVRFASLAPQGPVAAVYAAGDEEKKETRKDCRTTLSITRAESSDVPQTIQLWQEGTSQDDQKFREVVMSSPETPMVVEVSTNSPPPGGSICPRVLTMGNTAIPVPGGPVDLLVPANQTITLLFSSIDPNVNLFSGKKETFDGLSLGDGDLKADGFDVVSTSSEKTPLLHVVAHKGTDGITLHDLKLGAEQAKLSVGEVPEQADAWANGKKFPVFDLVATIQKNQVLSYLIAAVLLPGLWVWIKKTCFPAKEEAPAAKKQPVGKPRKPKARVHEGQDPTAT